ELDKWNSL
nr:Chain C, peptide epitope [synthetic construct]